MTGGGLCILAFTPLCEKPRPPTKRWQTQVSRKDLQEGHPRCTTNKTGSYWLFARPHMAPRRQARLPATGPKLKLAWRCGGWSQNSLRQSAMPGHKRKNTGKNFVGAMACRTKCGGALTKMRFVHLGSCIVCAAAAAAAAAASWRSSSCGPRGLRTCKRM